MPQHDATATDPPVPSLRFLYHCWRRDLGNFSVRHQRRFEGFLVSMHQSGSHWLKFMLANAIAAHYGLPPPRYNHANDIIPGHRDPLLYPQAPRIGHSHTIPHPLARVELVRRLLRLPRYVVLVRDFRASLVSNFEKEGHRYAVGFSEFLRGDLRGKRYTHDLWFCVRFANAWVPMTRRHPRRAMLLRYEDLRADPAGELARVCAFLGLPVAGDEVQAAVAASTKERMQALHDPARPPGEVRTSGRDPRAYFSAADEAWLRAVCARHLRVRLGYDYESPATA